jgi:hypothetical protein
MAITLIRPYGTTPAGVTVEWTAELEAALIAQGLASAALVTAITVGAQTSDTYEGTANVAIAAASVVITNSNITANSKVWACVGQAAADGTALRVERIVPAAGSVTIYMTAAATAATLVDWAIVNPHGATVRN